MDDAAQPPDTTQHDHAWRKTEGDRPLLGDFTEYRCDLCPAVWP